MEVKQKNPNKNPLEIDEVQTNMNKMNGYLDQTKSEWMNKDFLDKVANNDKLK